MAKIDHQGLGMWFVIVRPRVRPNEAGDIFNYVVAKRNPLDNLGESPTPPLAYHEVCPMLRLASVWISTTTVEQRSNWGNTKRG